MSERREESRKPVHDRALLLHGPKRNEVLTLREVQQYGSDSFSDPDYIQLFGMTPTEWYARGIRLLGRTVVECTRDSLGDRIGRDVASIAALLPLQTQFVVIDPFAGSCNTLYWILRHVHRSAGIAASDRAVGEKLYRKVSAYQAQCPLRVQAVWKRFSSPKTARNRARWTSTRPSEPIFAVSGLESIRAQPQAMLTT